MNYPPGLAECGACGKPCRRRTSEIRVYMGQSVPIMASRTLVGDRFLPSCSEACRKMLQTLSKARQVRL